MKLSKFLSIAIMGSLVTSVSFAEGNVGAIYKAGLALIDVMNSQGITTPLNPVVCVSMKGFTRVIYSHDFRHDGTVFVVKANTVTRLTEAQANIKESRTGRITENEIQQFDITLKGNDFKCERNLMQLEGVPMH